MIIIVEGPDNVGKGTQIEKIKEWMERTSGPTYVMHYAKMTSCPDNCPDTPFFIDISAEQYSTLNRNWELLSKVDKMRILSEHHYRKHIRLLGYHVEHGMNVIVDRSYISEQVYAPLYRGYSGIETYFSEYKEIECDSYYSDIILDIAAILYMDDAKNLLERDDGLSMSEKLEDREKENDKFVEVFNRSVLKNKIMITITDKTPQIVFDETEEFLNSVFN